MEARCKTGHTHCPKILRSSCFLSNTHSLKMKKINNNPLIFTHTKSKTNPWQDICNRFNINEKKMLCVVLKNKNQKTKTDHLILLGVFRSRCSRFFRISASSLIPRFPTSAHNPLMFRVIWWKDFI